MLFGSQKPNGDSFDVSNSVGVLTLFQEEFLCENWVQHEHSGLGPLEVVDAEEFYTLGLLLLNEVSEPGDLVRFPGVVVVELRHSSERHVESGDSELLESLKIQIAQQFKA